MQRIESTLNLILRQGERIMAVLDELRAALAESNVQTTAISNTLSEIAADLDDLIAKLGTNPPGSQEVIDATNEANALVQRLRDTAAAALDVAAKHTP